MGEGTQTRRRGGGPARQPYGRGDAAEFGDGGEAGQDRGHRAEQVRALRHPPAGRGDPQEPADGFAVGIGNGVAGVRGDGFGVFVRPAPLELLVENGREPGWRAVVEDRPRRQGEAGRGGAARSAARRRSPSPCPLRGSRCPGRCRRQARSRAARRPRRSPTRSARRSPRRGSARPAGHAAGRARGRAPWRGVAACRARARSGRRRRRSSSARAGRRRRAVLTHPNRVTARPSWARDRRRTGVRRRSRRRRSPVPCGGRGR